MSGLDRTGWSALTSTMVSFDGGIRTVSSCYQPDRYRFWDDCPVSPPAISRGAGLSYTAASFGAANPSVEHRHFNRMLDFDSATGVLLVESGATLGDINRFAAPRRWMLKTQPGHPAISIGGCIGADVHGKNQFRDGTFVEQVEGLRLFHPRHGFLDLSRRQNPDLFYLTCGGYGLTGNILHVYLRLSPLPAYQMVLRTTLLEDVRNLEQDFRAVADESDLIYSWHNFTARGDEFGKGHMVSGRFVENGAIYAGEGKPGPLEAATRGLPFPFFNSWTTPLFNSLYGAAMRRTAGEKTVPLYDSLFPVASKQLYFHLFGKRGFIEYQVLTQAEAFPYFVDAIRERLQREPVPITLVGTKLFSGGRDLLRFTGAGVCLALNFPRCESGMRFASFLDACMREHGGWPNLIKDSRLTANVVAAAYPEYERFRQELRNFDPERLYRSELSERLGL